MTVKTSAKIGVKSKSFILLFKFVANRNIAVLGFNSPSNSVIKSRTVLS